MGNTKKNGTSSLRNHLNSCKKLPLSGQTKQTQLSLQSIGENENILTKWQFDQKSSRSKLAAMIIIDELPFKFVENEGFRDFMQTTQPNFKIPSRFTVSRDCYQLYLSEKKRLTTYFKKSGQRICITTDTWTSLQRINYMCITAHYIDVNWNLHKKILNFCTVESHKGEIMGRDLDICLREWGVSKVFTVTVDNASSNTTSLNQLTGKLIARGCDILKGKYLHMRCIAHIINLIVTDGLKDECVKKSVKKVRDAVRFVRQSPARLAKFKECVEMENLESKNLLCLDVSTRWNSTYLMLNVAQKFQKAFDLFDIRDPYFKLELERGVPTFEDWDVIRRMVDMLVHFYELTVRISGSLYVTANVFYHEISTVNCLLRDWMFSDDVDVRSMGQKMKEKYDKYWGDPTKMNKLIYVAVIVDPRYKLEFVDFALCEEHGNELGSKLATDTREVMRELFEEYKLMYQPKVNQTQGIQEDPASNITSSSSECSRKRSQSALGDRFIRHKMESGEVESKCELDIYLKESVFVTKNDEFDILNWWKLNSSRFPILSQLARDVLAIPISTVASESTFSTGGRVLDAFRSSLTPKVVESLICAQNWLRKSKHHNSVEEDMISIEKIESGMLLYHILRSLFLLLSLSINLLIC